MIKSLALEKDRFRVFIEIDGNEETNVFPPEVTAQEIRDWHAEREAYYAFLKSREEELNQELWQ
jgi:hypothetical protein